MGEMAVGTQYRQPASAEFSWQQALTRIDRESVCSSPLLFVLLTLLVLLLGCDRFGASRLFVSCRRRGDISVNLGPLGRRVVRVEKGWRPSPCLACMYWCPHKQRALVGEVFFSPPFRRCSLVLSLAPWIARTAPQRSCLFGRRPAQLCSR
ncbi:unnamed protein product [Prorocentrum cordatum]|uniref:Uncharacterized protein n=1 Tax=Prorocentrum cordatum TaxID=2364126 RepID=A0ABN9XAC7_9DINO|nr:unnamed protein product [Polarella glacialis]